MIKFFQKISSLSFAIGLFATVGNIYYKVQYERVEQKGIETSATAKRITQYKSGSSGNLHVQFLDRDRVEQTAQTNIGDISEEILSTIRSNPTVKIKYLEQSPKNILAPSYSEDPINNMLEGTGLVVAGAVGLFLCGKYEQKRMNLKRSHNM